MYYCWEYNLLEGLFVGKIKGCCCFDMVFWYCYKCVVKGFGKIGVVDEIKGDNIGYYWINIYLVDI